jgi:hypothetical protein
MRVLSVPESLGQSTAGCLPKGGMKSSTLCVLAEPPLCAAVRRSTYSIGARSTIGTFAGYTNWCRGNAVINGHL